MKKKIKVLEIVDSIQYGGVEQMVYNYISHFNLDLFDFTIITTGKRFPDAEKKFKELGINIIGLPLKKENFFKYLIIMKNTIYKNKFDVVHSNINYWSFIPLFYAKRAGTKIRICHIHGTIKKTIKTKILSKLSMKYANNYLACSKAAGESVFENNKFIIIPNGIDMKKFNYNEDSRIKLREKLKIKKEEFVIGHIGRFYLVKNHKFLVELFHSFHNIKEESKLILIGDGELREKIKNDLTKLDLSNNVIFIDSTDDVSEYYSCFDTFVLPSINEGLGMVVLEAQCSGLKCLVSNGVPKDVDFSDNVKFLSLDNKDQWVKELLSIYEDRKRYEDNEKLLSSPFNINNTISKLERIYQVND